MLQEEFPSDQRRGDNEYQTTMTRFNDVRLDIDFNVSNSELRYVEKIDKILEEIGGEMKFSRTERVEFVKTLVRNIIVGADHRTNPEQLRELHTHLRSKTRITRVNKLLGYILRWIEPIRMMWNYGDKSGWHKAKSTSKETPKSTEQTTRDRSRPKGPRDRTPSNKFPQRAIPIPDRVECKGCGRLGHAREACRGKDHPDFNRADCDWMESVAM